MYGSGIVIITIISGVALLHYFYFGFYYGMKVRIAICSLIYRKVCIQCDDVRTIVNSNSSPFKNFYHNSFKTFQSLQLSQRALSDTAPGKLVNLLSNDVNRFDIISVVMHPLWTSPIMTIIAGFILWNEIRFAGMIGMAIVFLIVPIQSISISFFKLFSNHIQIKQIFFQSLTIYLNRLRWEIISCNSFQNSLKN